MLLGREHQRISSLSTHMLFYFNITNYLLRLSRRSSLRWSVLLSHSWTPHSKPYLMITQQGASQDSCVPSSKEWHRKSSVVNPHDILFRYNYNLSFKWHNLTTYIGDNHFVIRFSKVRPVNIFSSIVLYGLLTVFICTKSAVRVLICYSY